MRGHAEPDEELARSAKLDGWSMAYQVTSLGISGLSLLRGPEFAQFAAALAEIDTLDRDAAAKAVDDGVGALEARVSETMALCGDNVTPASPAAYQVALDYLLATMQAEISWLRPFASSLRSDQVEWRQAAPESKMPSNDEVGI